MLMTITLMLRYKLQVKFKERPMGHSEYTQWGVMMGANDRRQHF